MRRQKSKRRKTKPGHGARKGAGFERKVAGQLSKILYGEEVFLWRVGGSGGRATRQKGLGLFTGDICPVGLELPYPFRWHIECKFYREIRIDNLLYDTKSGGISKWWKKAKEEAGKNQPHVMLVLRQNNRPMLAVVSKSDWREIYSKIPAVSKIKRLSYPLLGIVICKFHDLMIEPVARAFKARYQKGGL